MFRLAGGFDACSSEARVMATDAALARCSENVAQGAVAEEVYRLVGQRERARRLLPGADARRVAIFVGVIWSRALRLDEALVRQALRQLFDGFTQLGVEPVVTVYGVLQLLVRYQVLVEQGLGDGLVQLFHRRRVIGVGIPRVAIEARLEQ